MSQAQKTVSSIASKKSKQRRSDPNQYLPSYLSPVVQYSHGDDFFISPRFDPSLIVQLMSEGFLPIATLHFLLPKLHKERCVINPIFDRSTNKCLIHTSHSTRKKCKRFSISVNQDFDKVVSGCHQQHGISWLYPRLVESFKHIHQGSMMATIFDDNYPHKPIGSCRVRLYSIEVWDALTGELAAGELGYSVGNIYTSLTGFTLTDGAGSVQLATLGVLLCKNDFETWDLGMDLEYKRRMGAMNLDRSHFVSLVKASREFPHDIFLPNMERCNCKDVMDQLL